MSKHRASAALVTGGAGAIGSAICARLIDDGWRVHGLDLRQGTREDVGWIVADVTRPEELEAAAAELNRLDLLINGAGFGDRAAAEAMTGEQWTRVVDAASAGRSTAPAPSIRC